MNTADFLRQVWPDEGIYCLASPNQGYRGFHHEVVDSIEKAVAWIEANRQNKDIYFCMHTLRAPKHFNSTRKNKDGTLGKYETRSHANMKEVRCFFMEIDVGEAENKYPDQATALQALKAFCKKTGLPPPLITSSGRGLHIFWPLSTPIAVETFCVEAFKLYQLTLHENLLIDESRILDQSSILRVPGTLHLKDPSNPRPVRVLRPAKTTDTAEFLSRLDEAFAKTGRVTKMRKTGNIKSASSAAPALVVNIVRLPVDEPAEQAIPEELLIPPSSGESSSQEKYGPPPTLDALMTACAQFKALAETKGNVPEPRWYMGIIGLAQFVENGRQVVHDLSSGHPQYDEYETNLKLDQWEGKGPTSCAKIAETCGESLCSGCQFSSAERNPIWAARHLHLAPLPRAQYMVGTTALEVTLTGPPPGFQRTNDNRVTMTRRSKDGVEYEDTILDYDLYPVRRLVNKADHQSVLIWRAHLPRGEVVDIEMPAGAMYKKEELFNILANHQVFPDPQCHQPLVSYMSAYIRDLQKALNDDPMVTHLGWGDDNTSFILPDRVIFPDGTAKMASLAKGAREVCKDIRVSGTLEGQIANLKFFDSPHYLANQFFIMCALGSPLLRYTTQHGAIVNATGQSGASKSTTLYTAASLWGHPVHYTLNGTQTGATKLARENHYQVLSNLPLCVDEITHMEPKDAHALALSISQAGARKRLDKAGNPIPGPSNVKAALMLSTANTSLHQLLSTRNSAGTAGSMRVFEIEFRPSQVHTKTQADEYLRDLNQHYGHIGPIMAAYYTMNQKKCEERVIETMADLDKQAQMLGSERFWTAVAASALTATEIANRAGLCDYSAAQLLTWLCRQQLPSMRGVVGEEYSTPIGVLQDFLMKNSGHMAVMRDNVLIHGPVGEMVGEYQQNTNVISIVKKAFKEYCITQGANPTTILNQLYNDGVVTNKRHKVSLCKGTPKFLGSATCIIVNAAHVSMQSVETNLESARVFAKLG